MSRSGNYSSGAFSLAGRENIPMGKNSRRNIFPEESGISSLRESFPRETFPREKIPRENCPEEKIPDLSGKNSFCSRPKYAK